MRVLLHQSATGLFSPSGGYRSNLAVLQYLASQGHTVQQIVCAYEKEIQEYVAEQKSKGSKISVNKYSLHIPCTTESSTATSVIGISLFTMHDGVRVTAIDASDVKAFFQLKDLRNMTQAFVEVCYLLLCAPTR